MNGSTSNRETVDEYLARGGKITVIEYHEPSIKAELKKTLQKELVRELGLNRRKDK